MSRTASVEALPPNLATRVSPQISVVVYHNREPRVVPLTDGGGVVLGRSVEAEVSIQEPTLSRHHARVQLRDGEVWIEDLGSSNGTWVNGSPVRQCKLTPDDHILLGGAVTLSIHIESHTSGLQHHCHFIGLLEQEMTRSKVFDHQLALIMVRNGKGTCSSSGAPPEVQQYGAWVPTIREMLRPVDRIALHSPGVVEVLLPETSPLAAVRLAERIASAQASLRCGVGVFPIAAQASDLLVARTLATLERATDIDPVVLVASEGPRHSTDRDAELVWGAAMQPVLQLIERIAPSDLPVLVYGETGAGKEVVARAIHQASPRRGRPLRCINCGAIPRDLVQSTLFGHERGAFTGASQQRKGMFEEAHGGTLLLDEVGELPPEAQVALLRVLETGLLTRVGSATEVPVDVRVISATHRDLEQLCTTGLFRRDLFYRLNPVALQVPPLRERRDEIVPLAELFVGRAAESSGQPPKPIEPDVLSELERYDWPGNIRELRNAMERAVLVAVGPTITCDDLPPRLQTLEVEASRCRRDDETPAVRRVDDGQGEFKNKVRNYEIMVLRRALAHTDWNKKAAAERLQMPLRTLMYKVRAYGLRPLGSPHNTTLQVSTLEGKEGEEGFKPRVRAFERALLLEALDLADWNRAEAARRLGLPLSTLLYKVKALGLAQQER